ncbi:MAG: hypothetical protein HEP71_17590 [Roseivirga sp.]|nr:hypothetical protein [Roseivirga sp.]
MTRLLKKGLFFALLTLVPYGALQYFIITNYDPIYTKLVGKHKFVITGVSRAKIGLSPMILHEEMELKAVPQNLAISNLSTPYGPFYYAFLQKKITIQEAADHFHLISVSPVSIMDVDDTLTYSRESHDLIYKLQSVSNRPNLEYVFRIPSFEMLHNQIRLSLTESQMVLKMHNTGWMEVNPKGDFRMSINYIDAPYRPSLEREEYLRKTISLLEKTGNVFLIRMPVSSSMLQIEKNLYPNFDEVITKIAHESSVPYLDYTADGDSYEFYDNPGHHLTGKSARDFTRVVTKDLKKILSED